MQNVYGSLSEEMGLDFFPQVVISALSSVLGNATSMVTKEPVNQGNESEEPQSDCVKVHSCLKPSV